MDKTQEPRNPVTPFVSFKPSPIKGKVRIRFVLITNYKREADGMYSCYIPALDLYYMSSTREEINKRAGTMGKLFFQDFFDTYTKDPVKKIFIELRKLGFQSQTDFAYTIHQLSKQNVISSKFSKHINQVPSDFQDSSEMIHENENDLAFA